MSSVSQILRSAVAFAALAFAALMLSARTGHAQACCAGASAITPGRLELHERALVGAALRVSRMLGAFDADGRFRTPGAGTSEWDFEQDLFGSVALFRRAQLSLLVPVLESRRAAKTVGSELGGGLGDVNTSARYDFTRAREYRYVPGIAALAGVTFPTGRPPEDAHLALASDATGLGAAQVSLGLAFERAQGDWLLNLSALVAQRFARTAAGVRSSLATQVTGLVAVGYSLAPDVAVACVTSYTQEGDATVDGQKQASTGRRQVRVALAMNASLSDTARLQGSVFFDPPLAGLGKNQLASAGVTVTLIRSFL